MENFDKHQKPPKTPLNLNVNDLTFTRIYDAYYILDFANRPLLNNQKSDSSILAYLGTHPNQGDFLHFNKIITKTSSNNNNYENVNNKNEKKKIEDLLDTKALGRIYLKNSFSKMRWDKDGIVLAGDSGDISFFPKEYDFDLLGKKTQILNEAFTLKNPYSKKVTINDFHLKNDYLVSIYDCEIGFWDISSQKIFQSHAHKNSIVSSCFHYHSSLLGFLDEESQISFYDQRSNTKELLFQNCPENKKNLKNFLFSKEAENLFLTTNGKLDFQSPVIHIWDIRKKDFPVFYLTDYWSKGIKSINWCEENSALLLLSTVDDQTLFLNPYSEQVISRVDIDSNIKMEWNPELSGILTTHTKNGNLFIFSLDDIINAEPAEENQQKKIQSATILQSFRFSFPYENEKIVHFDLTDLMNDNPKKEIVQQFCDEIQRRSFSIIKLPKNIKKVVDEIWKTSSDFFKFSNEIKEPIKILPWRDVGYMSTKGVKEFWQMRKSECPNFPWPDESKCPDFKKKFSNAFDTFQNIGKYLISALAEGLKVPQKNLTDMMDFNPLPSKNSFTNSILSVYHYYKNERQKESCDIHKDMGMITLVPTAMVPGLQVLDYDTLSWIEIEKIAKPDELVCFISESMERATGGFYTGCIHRVIREYDEKGQSKERSSIVHKIRCRTECFFDCLDLKSPVLTVPEKYKERIMARDFIKKQLSKRESVNFPSKNGFVTYANCILDPDRNGSEDYFQKTQTFLEEDIQHNKDYSKEENNLD